MYKLERAKTWPEKVTEVRHCYMRSHTNASFAEKFYKSLFFLRPQIKDYFDKKGTDWDHQEKALMHGMEHLFNFFADTNDYHHTQIARLAASHSHKNLNIHPHDYYYWMDALIMTLKECDDLWYDTLEHYLRECLFFPISFMISFYYK